MTNYARYWLAIAFLSSIFFFGCDQQQVDELCEARIRLTALKVESSHSPNYGYQPDSAALTDELRDLLTNCDTPEHGVSIAPDYALSLPELYMLANDMDGANRTLDSSIATLSKPEAAQLLGSAARYGDLSILKSVVRKGVDPTLHDEVGNNALMAVPGGREPKIEKIQFLLENGVPLGYRTNDDFSILDVAIFTEDLPILLWILEHLDHDSDDHVNLVRKSLEIATKVESPMSSDLNDWLSDH